MQAAYISRFRTHTERAYATGVTPGAEMVRVQTLFLRGLRDNALSRRTFHKTENKTLEETMEVAQTLANENYRFSPHWYLPVESTKQVLLPLVLKHQHSQLHGMQR